MFLDILEFREENKKKLFRENGFKNMVLDLKKNVVCVHKTILEKSEKQKKIKTNTMKTFKTFGGFWGQN